MAVNLAKGVFRFTTGALDKRAYTISTPTASIGVRGTVLDIDVRSAQSRVTLVEGQALVCPRGRGSRSSNRREIAQGPRAARSGPAATASISTTRVRPRRSRRAAGRPRRA